MLNIRRLAIVGSGPSALYLLRHIADAADRFASAIESISIFEKDEHIGRGMPYTPTTTDRFNLGNISSEELLPLEIPFAQWLRETGGIDIDENYRVIGEDDQPNDRIFDIAFPHATGVRPYSYGLQACELTARLVAEHWMSQLSSNRLPREVAS